MELYRLPFHLDKEGHYVHTYTMYTVQHINGSTVYIIVKIPLYVATYTVV